MNNSNNHSHPNWVNLLFLFTLIVFLNTPVAVTMTTGIDQYSLYTFDWSRTQIDRIDDDTNVNFILTLVIFSINIGVAFIAFIAYILLRYSARIISYPNCPTAILNAIFIFVSTAIAIAPSFFLSHTEHKAYYFIIWFVTTAGISAISAWSSSTTYMDHRTAVTILNSAAIALTLLAVGAIGPLCNLPAKQVPPNGNWFSDFEVMPPGYVSFLEDQDSNNTKNQDHFTQNFNNGVRIFIISSVLYGVVILGAALLYSIYESRRMTFQIGLTRDELVEAGLPHLIHKIPPGKRILPLDQIREDVKASVRTDEEHIRSTSDTSQAKETSWQQQITIVLSKEYLEQLSEGFRVTIDKLNQPQPEDPTANDEIDPTDPPETDQNSNTG